MKTCPAISLLSVAAFMLTSAGVAASQTGMASKVERWGMQEIVLHSSRPYQNPFREVNLSAKFTCPGEQKTVTGFYDGDSSWKVRFMPEQLGRCEFKTTSNDPEMNNQSGGFEVTAAGTGNHGPVQVAKIYHFLTAGKQPKTDFSEWAKQEVGSPVNWVETLQGLGKWNAAVL